MAGASVPPQLASPQVPVNGDLPVTIQRPVIMLPVPVSRPETNPNTLSGPSGSAPAGMARYRV